MLVQSTERCRHPTTSVIAPLRARFNTKWLCSYASCYRVDKSELSVSRIQTGVFRRMSIPLRYPKRKTPKIVFSSASPVTPSPIQSAAYFLLFLPAAAGLGVTTFAGAGVERALAGAAGAPGAGVPLCIQLMICCVAIGMMNNNALFP